MNFAVKLLDKVSDVNHFSEVEVIELIRGNPYSLYFRVVQPNKDSLRYVPAASSTGLVKFKHTNDAKRLIAPQPILFRRIGLFGK